MIFYHTFYLFSSNYINLIITAQRVRVSSVLFSRNLASPAILQFVGNFSIIIQSSDV